MHKRANNNAIIKYIIIGFLIISPIIIAPVVVFLLFNKQKIVPIGDYEISTSISPTTIRNGETKEITSSKINVNNEIATNDFLDYLSCNTSNNEYYSQTLIINDLSISVDDGIVIISISINETNTFYGVFKFRIYFSMKNIEASTSSSTIVELNILKDGLNWEQDDLLFLNYAKKENPITLCMGPTQAGATPWTQTDLEVTSGLQNTFAENLWNQLNNPDTFQNSDIFSRLANHFNFCIRFSLTGSTDILDNRFSCQDLLQNKLPNFSNEKAERNYKFIHFGRGSSVGGFNSGNCVSLETIEPDLKFWTQHEFMGHTILNLEDEYPQGTGQGNLIEEPQSQVDLIELRHMNFSNFGIDYIASSSQQWCGKNKDNIFWKKMIDSDKFSSNIDDYCPNGDPEKQPVQWWNRGAHASSEASAMRGNSGNFSDLFIFTMYLKCHVKEEDRENEWNSGSHFDLTSSQEAKDELWNKYLSWNEYIQQKMEKFINWY